MKPLSGKHFMKLFFLMPALKPLPARILQAFKYIYVGKIPLKAHIGGYSFQPKKSA